jgi:hypothetical protein
MNMTNTVHSGRSSLWPSQNSATRASKRLRHRLTIGIRSLRMSICFATTIYTTSLLSMYVRSHFFFWMTFCCFYRRVSLFADSGILWQPFEFDYDYSPSWRFVARYMRWTRQLEIIADSYVRKTIGVPNHEPTPSVRLSNPGSSLNA